MVCMAGLQVFIVRFFFQGARKGKSFLSQCSFEKEQPDSRRRIRVNASPDWFGLVLGPKRIGRIIPRVV